MEEGPVASILSTVRPLAACSRRSKNARGGMEEGLGKAAMPLMLPRWSDTRIERGRVK